jgi:6-phosphofructokinase
MRIAISTGGGDAPGLNAVIRAAVLSAINRGWDVLGIKRGFAGLLGEDECIPLTKESVRGIAHLGGTILRSTNRGNPFYYPRPQPDGSITTEIATKLCDKGMRIVGVPKTIDNDVSGTVTTFGFDTAVNTALEAIDKLHTTAESHDRVMIMEVMGRDAGFIALHSGVAGTADVILIPEIPYDLGKVCEKVMSRHRAGRQFSIVVVAEGAFPRGRRRRRDRARDPDDHRQGDPLAGAGPSPARGHADGLRPPARDPVRRRRGARDRRREVGPHGGAPDPAHRDRADRGSAP